MPLETATYISDLVVTNPVHATDDVSAGDDHIRLIKSAIKNTFSAITGEVTVSHTVINGVQDASNLNSGTLPDERLSSNVPLKDEANTFAATQTISVADGTLQLDLRGATGKLLLYGRSGGGSAFLQSLNLAGTQFEPLSIEASTLALAGSTAITLNGVNVTDFARKSQSNAFTASSAFLGKSAATGSMALSGGTSASTDSTIQLFGSSHATLASRAFYDAAQHDFRSINGASSYFRIDASGNFDFTDGTVTTANSSSSEVGYKGAPTNGKTADHTIVAADSGTVIVCTSSADDITVQASGAPPAGSVVGILNKTGGSIDILQGSGMTLTLAGTPSTGSRTLAANGMAFVYFDSSSTATVGGSGVA